MKKFLLIFFPILSFCQVQIGNDINGETAFNASGRSVSISGDGNIVAIGAQFNSDIGNNSGHVRVYKNINNIWTQVGSDIDGEAAGDGSGNVSLSEDGNIVAIGAGFNDGNGNASGHVRVYKNVNDIWTQVGSDIDGEAADDRLGSALSLSGDGNILAIGAPGNDGNGNSSGHVRVYKNVNDVWTQVGSDIDGEAADDFSGWRVSLSNNGNVVAIAARSNDGNGNASGHVRVYKNVNDVWTQVGLDINGEAANDGSGDSVSLSEDGSILAIGAEDNDGNGNSSGHVRVYKNVNDVWTQIGSDIDGEAADDGSGYSLSISNNGNIVAIGARLNDGNGNASGHVRVYKNVNDVWTQVGSDIDGEAADDVFGWSVSLSNNGDLIAIGASGNDGNGNDSGHVRIYDLSSVLSTESFKQDYFSFYPNPVKDYLNIEINQGLELKKINIYNGLSQYLYSVKISKIDFSNLSSGFYFIEVETNKGKSAKKIIIE